MESGALTVRAHGGGAGRAELEVLQRRPDERQEVAQTRVVRAHERQAEGLDRCLGQRGEEPVDDLVAREAASEVELLQRNCAARRVLHGSTHEVLLWNPAPPPHAIELEACERGKRAAELLDVVEGVERAGADAEAADGRERDLTRLHFFHLRCAKPEAVEGDRGEGREAGEGRESGVKEVEVVPLAHVALSLRKHDVADVPRDPRRSFQHPPQPRELLVRACQAQITPGVVSGCRKPRTADERALRQSRRIVMKMVEYHVV